MIRAFTASDYPMVSEWWASHGRTPVPLNLLPPTGIVVDEIVAGWLIKTDGGIGILEHVVSSPEASNRAIYKAINSGMDTLIRIAEASGLYQVWGVVCNKALSKAYQRRGFAKQQGNFNVFVGAL